MGKAVEAKIDVQKCTKTPAFAWAGITSCGAGVAVWK